MKKRIKFIAVAILLLGLIGVIGSGWIIRSSARGRTYSDVSRIPYRKVGVVLGCAERLSDGRVNLFFSHRIVAAAQLIKGHKVDYLIVSGDNHVAGYDEPSDMKRALVSAGVPADRIYCDYAGFRTLDSMVRAKVIFGQDAVSVVSQEFHNQRAIYIASRHGLDVIGYNAQSVDRYNSFRTNLREQFARVRTVLDTELFRTRPRFFGPTVEIGMGR